MNLRGSLMRLPLKQIKKLIGPVHRFGALVAAATLLSG